MSITTVPASKPASRRTAKRSTAHPSFQTARFCDEWNRSFPNVEAAQAQLDERGPKLREQLGKGWDTSYAKWTLHRLNDYLADAESLRDADPVRYAAGKSLRVAAPARTSHDDFTDDDQAAFRFVDWLVREWAPAWIDAYVAKRQQPGSIDLTEWAEGLRNDFPAVESYRGLLDHSTMILQLYRSVSGKYYSNRRLTNLGAGKTSRADVKASVDRSGFRAAIAGADGGDGAVFIDTMTETLLNVLREAVVFVAEAIGGEEFNAITTTLSPWQL